MRTRMEAIADTVAESTGTDAQKASVLAEAAAKMASIAHDSIFRNLRMAAFDAGLPKDIADPIIARALAADAQAPR